MVNFKVKKNKFFFIGPRWNFFGIDKKEFNIKACFLDNCIYRLSENYDQINKLFGHSYRLFPFYDKINKLWRPGHHKNSVRFGWRCVNGLEIEILAYIYINGIRTDKKIMSIGTMEWVHLNFKETTDHYTFKVISENGSVGSFEIKKGGVRKGFLGLFINRLYPYFGGKIPSPHDMTIKLKYLKKFI